MRVVVVGLGNQGRKRITVAGEEVVATVDPFVPGAQHKNLEEVPLASFDAALVCTPDEVKLDALRYLLSQGKHVLVEKPLLAPRDEDLAHLGDLARANGVTCYTAYNHRFEPHVARLKAVLDEQMLGTLYFARGFYGNGTALDVKRSWRDQGLGVLADLGSHLLDLVLFLLGPRPPKFEAWAFNRFETRAWDHILFGSPVRPAVVFEATLLSWRNTFALDVVGERGSAHIRCLCKWGPSTFVLRRRAYPSGRPEEEAETLESADPTWALEYEHFKGLCRTGRTNIDNDIWINGALHAVAGEGGG
jgi:predicted dehydrogenase